MKPNLTFKTVEVSCLSQRQRERMYDLMAASYSSMERPVFERDLDKKQMVGLILDEQEVVQGFTTFAINPKDCGTGNYNILFSGDTIISPAHWGSLVMVKGWCAAVGEIIATDRSKEWYWYLLSKGHRTYMYLPLFFHEYYPSVHGGSKDEKLKSIADRVSAILYPEYWLPKAGVLKFESDAGALSSELAQGTYARKKNEQVAFFLEKNPGFYQGDELVCTAELHPDNFKRSAKDYVLQGMNRLNDRG